MKNKYIIKNLVVAQIYDSTKEIDMLYIFEPRYNNKGEISAYAEIFTNLRFFKLDSNIENDKKYIYNIKPLVEYYPIELSIMSVYIRKEQLLQIYNEINRINILEKYNIKKKEK